MKNRIGLVSFVLTVLVVWPLLPGMPYDLLNTAILACGYAIVALSLVLLIGLVGQISLCQAALVGMGAFVGAIATRRFGVEFPWTLLVGLGAGAATATLIGLVALRVRGLYLAVATLIFAYVCDQYLFTQPWLVENQSGTTIPPEAIGNPGTIPYFDLTDAHVFYYVALATATVVLFSLANLRESRIGRAFAALRGSEVAAASLGINVVSFKLLGFACAGALAGLAGALTLVGSLTVAPAQFDFSHSLYYLAIAVVGGLRSLGGALASSVLFAVLVGEVFYRSPKLADYLDIISSGLLIVVLLFFRGGLGAVPERLPALVARMRPWVDRVRPFLPMRPVRDRIEPRPAPWSPLVGRVRRTADSLRERTANVVRGAAVRWRRAEPAEASDLVQSPLDVTGLVARLTPEPPLRLEVIPAEPIPAALSSDQAIRALMAGGDTMVAGTRGPDGRRLPVLLAAEHITVRFGGLTAVNDAAVQVGAGEIVGLIGPNGAGKTTLFNALLGLNSPVSGTVSLFGRDVTSWGVHQRAALGVGRTFQVLQLFGDLTVFDNLLVATHLQNRTGLFGSLVVTRGARRSERRAAERVQAVLRLMNLEDFADRRVTGLPFGVLRLVEVARTLVTGARLVCFDEPASGLDSAETERLIDWFRFLRQIGVTLLVIEHDVDMVVRLCDHIYVLDQGRLLASGTPAAIQRDPAVISSYLGTSLEVAS